MRRALRFILFLSLLTLPATVTGLTFHVDPNGSNANPGSAQAPWQTLQHAATQMSAGDTVVAAPGVYTEQVFVSISGTAAAPITFQASAGAVLESPDPSASTSAFDVQPGAGHIVIDGFEIRGGFHETVYLRAGAHHVTVRKCDIHHNRVGIWLAGANDIEIDGCTLRENTVVGLRVDGDSHDVLIRDTASDGNDDGLACSGDADGFVVEETAYDVTFIGCSASGNSEDGFDLQGDRVLVARSRSQGNQCVGIKTGQNARIENAVVTGNATGIATTSILGVPIAVEVLNSIVADNSANQIRFAQPNIAPVEYEALARNLVVRGAGKAIEAEPYVSLIEDHNILYRDDSFSRLIVRHVGAVEEFFTGAQINAGEWTAHSGHGTGTLAVDPDFLAVPGYLLAADSAAIDGGTSLDAPSDDIVSAPRPQGNATDAGPYESDRALDNRRPWAEPGPDRWGVAGFPLSFVAYGSVDPDGDPLSYTWDFGDGSPGAAGYATSHTWLQAGNYTLTLTASDGPLERSRSAQISISPAPTATPSATPSRTATPTRTSTPTRTPTLTATATLAPTNTPNLTRDSVVLPVRPLKVKIGRGTAATIKGLRVTVYNGDPQAAGDTGHVIRLSAENLSCPAGMVGAADFDSRAPGAQPALLIAPGRGARASVNVTVAAADFTTLNRKTPQRCLLRLVVSAEVDDNSDPTPENNAVVVPIDVYDLNDVEQPAVAESVLAVVKPLALKVPRGSQTAGRRIAFRVSNGDVIPERAVPGHTIDVSVSDGDCPPGTVSGADMDPFAAGTQSSVALVGGARATGTITVEVDADDFASSSRKVPARCTAQLTARGPIDDGDPSNDSVPLLIDVADLNDF